MNDNTDEYRSGTELLAQWGCFNREQKLEQACRALMQQLDDLHTKHKNQSLSENLDNKGVYCSCADAYRMGHVALRKEERES